MVDTIYGVGVVVRRGHAFLLGQRLGTLGRGTWGFPGGHVDSGEDPFACAARELKEETGMDLSLARSAGWHRHFDSGRLYVTLYVEGEVTGEPVLREPQKCAGWSWFNADEMPSPLFIPTAGYFAVTEERS